MKLKLDENLGLLGQSLLEGEGHDVMTVAEQRMSGAQDNVLYQHCRNEGRVLVTARALDKLDPSKVIPTPQHIESTPKKLTAGELTEALPDEDIVDAEVERAAERDASILEVIERELEAVAPHDPELVDRVPAPEGRRGPTEQSA